jgi:hypothetical protein
MIELFHVSDLHLGKSDSQSNRAEALLRAIEEKNQIGSNADKRLLISGDLVDSRKDENYRRAEQALRPFKSKIIIVPGNHEYGPVPGIPGFGYSKENARYFDQFLNGELGFDHAYFKKALVEELIQDSQNLRNRVLVIGLNSCHERECFVFRPWGSQGVIGRKQRRTLAGILAKPEYDGTPKVVLLHHIPNRFANEIWMHLVDWKKLTTIVSGRVQAISFGHEGKMDKMRKLKLFRRRAVETPAARGMSVLRNFDGIENILDANDSVADFACYHIKIEDNKLEAEKEMYA